MEIEVALPARARLGEGAVWDTGDQALWWTDIKGRKIHRTAEDGTDEVVDFGEEVGCLARRDDGGLVLAARSGFHLFDPSTGARTPIGDPERHLPDNRFNDGATDNRGRFWAGTMNDDTSFPERCGSFYRLGTDRRIVRELPGVFTTNGMTFSPDGRTMYFSDSNPGVRSIWRADYDPDTGAPSNIRLFFDTREVAGRPDGGTVDADGCYWMAGVSGGQVVRITPEGRVDKIIEMPVEKPTKTMFGGANLDILYVTTIGMGYPDGGVDGHLFAITGLGVTGIAQHRYAG